MGYSSRKGRRPVEAASKASHGHVISDPQVQAFLKNCSLPGTSKEVDFASERVKDHVPCENNPITHVVAVDGGYTEIAVRSEFPSCTLAFLQFGALIFSVADLDAIGAAPFVRPEEIEKLKKIQRLQLTLPLRNICFASESTLTNSVRRAVYDFFRSSPDDEPLMETLRWLIFEEFGNPKPVWTLANCPSCHVASIPISRDHLSKASTAVCNKCGAEILLTDVLRLHEAVDDEVGAGGILGYVVTAIEQLLVFHLIRLVLRSKPSLLKNILFIKDGPLAFFGQTANLHTPARSLIAYLQENHDLSLAGLEKSGAFVEHAAEIDPKLRNSSVVVLDNDYIYRYIIPGKSDPANPYGRTTYYSNKVIFKTGAGQIYVVSLPTPKILVTPTWPDFKNIECILTNIEKLRCDMYENSLVPVALANKLVSLANHPSSKILQKFAVGTVQP